MHWIFFTDYEKYFTRKVGNMPLKPMTLRNHITFWGFKLIHAAVFVAIPIYMLGFVPWLIGFLIYGMFTGFVLSMVFQLAHVVEETQFPVAIQPINQLEDEWAVHQLKTTANFATKNKLISWLVGGLRRIWYSVHRASQNALGSGFSRGAPAAFGSELIFILNP